MKILSVIPARSGSKGIANKNIALLGGKPLLYYSIKALIESSAISEICFTTDSDEYITIVQDYFPEVVSILRPDSLAGDRTPDTPVLLDALEQYANHRPLFDPTHILMVHVTSPFLLSSDIDDSITAFVSSGSHDSMVSVVQCDSPSYKHKVIRDGFLYPASYALSEVSTSRRQDSEQIFIRNGAFYLMSIEQLKAGSMWGSRVLPYVMPKLRSIDINDSQDLELARCIFPSVVVTC